VSGPSFGDVPAIAHKAVTDAVERMTVGNDSARARWALGHTVLTHIAHCSGREAAIRVAEEWAESMRTAPAGWAGYPTLRLVRDEAAMKPDDVFLGLARHALLRHIALNNPEALWGAVKAASQNMVEKWGQDPEIARRAVAYAVASVAPQDQVALALCKAGIDPEEIFAPVRDASAAVFASMREALSAAGVDPEAAEPPQAPDNVLPFRKGKS
jgi:hypothetical protein